MMNLSTSRINPILLGLSCLTVCAISIPGLTLEVQDVSNPQEHGGWVTDMADILSDETEAQLNQIITELEATNGSEMAVVTVPETAPSASPKAFATELFNHWGIGKAEQDNGVLFLISVDDRRVEIETGYGIEAILPDAQVGQIIDTQITPRFQQGDFDGGTLAGTQAIADTLTETVPLTDATDATDSDSVDDRPRSQPEISDTADSGYSGWGAALGGLVLLTFTGLSFAHLSRSRDRRRSGNLHDSSDFSEQQSSDKTVPDNSSDSDISAAIAHQYSDSDIRTNVSHQRSSSNQQRKSNDRRSGSNQQHGSSSGFWGVFGGGGSSSSSGGSSSSGSSGGFSGGDSGGGGGFGGGSSGGGGAGGGW
jgi:uncharacterized protein